MIETNQPDARIVGGLFIYILPEHIWGKVPVGRARPVATSPSCRWSAAGPTSSPSSSAGGSCAWSGTRSGGRGARVRRDPVHQVRHRGRGRARAAAGRDRHDPRGRSRRRSSASASEPNIETVRERRRPSYTELAFNLCSEQNCPDAEFNPAVQDRDRAPGDRLRDRPRAHQRDLRRWAPRSSATASCRRSTSRSTRCPEQDYPARRRAGEPDARRRRLGRTTATSRARRTARALVRPLRALGVAVRHPGGEADRRDGRRRSGSSSTSRWSAPTSSPSSRSARSTASRRRTSTPSSGAGAAIRTTRASCSACSPPTRSAPPRTPSTRTPSTTGSSRSRPASSTSTSARR